MRFWFKFEDWLNTFIKKIQLIFLIKKSKRNKDPLSPGFNKIIQEMIVSSGQWILFVLSNLNPIKLLGFVPGLLEELFQTIGMWITSLRYPLVIALSIVLFLSGKHAIDQIRILKHKAITIIKRKNKNAKDSIFYRPIYHKKYDKHFTVYSVRIPIHGKNKRIVKQIIIDFTVETSNKYLKEYLDRKIYMVKDRFNTTIEPIIPELPLKKEGKSVLANKLKREINNLIHELKIKGEVEKVYIHSILVS